MKRSEVDRNKLAPMMRHYIELKDNYEDVLLFYRLGDFYEMFFEDAELVSHELELTLTGRNAGLEERIPMCGVPHHSVDSYIEKLVKKGYKVALCEQLEDAKNVKGIVKRDVTEIISTGTLINTSSLNEKENNYIGSLYSFCYCYSLCYTDITTGEIYITLMENNINKIVNEIISTNLKEVVLNNDVDKKIVSLLEQMGGTFKVLLGIMFFVAVLLIIGLAMCLKISNSGMMYR